LGGKEKDWRNANSDFGEERRTHSSRAKKTLAVDESPLGGKKESFWRKMDRCWPRSRTTSASTFVTSPTQPAARAGQPATAHVQPTTGLYGSPEEAVKSLKDDYSYWTGKLTESSFALSLAVIAANWAVFGSVDKIRDNVWAELSIAFVILSLGMSLIGNGWLGHLLRRRIEYAEKNQARWQKEYQNATKSRYWPSTEKIDRLAERFRSAKIVLPVIGGAFFLIALFSQPSARIDQSAARLPASPTAVPLAAPSPFRTSTPP
jgi:hypothetical protein